MPNLISNKLIPSSANILLLVLFVSQSSAQQPSWVKKRPLLDGYYIGIGVASKHEAGNSYRQKAKNSALNDLASEIAVNISGEIISIIVEQSGFIDEQVRSEIRAQTQATLESYERVDTWENDREYWVYYRLSKDRFENQKQLKKQKAISQSLNFLAKGHSSGEAQEFSNALFYYFQALNPLRTYIDDPLEVSYNHRTIYLKEEIFTSLQNLLGKIKLAPGQERLQVKISSQLNETVEVLAYYSTGKDSIPVAHLPLRFSFSRGAGKIDKTTRSNESGIAICHITRLAPTHTTQTLQAELDLSAYATEQDMGKITFSQVNRLAIPKATITLEISAPIVLVDVQEENLGETLTIPIIEPVLKTEFLEKGLTLTENNSDADYMVHLIAKSREGSQSQNLYTAFVDITILLIDAHSGKEIYRNSFQNVNGVNLNLRKAGMAAFQNVCEKIKKDLIPALLAKVFLVPEQ
jgi:hypothetical protein